VQGSGSYLAVAVYVVLLFISMEVENREWRGVAVAADWMPLLALPVLYSQIPATIVYGDERVFDPFVQGWDRALFGTDPARTMAGTLPNVVVSEALHLAYLSYYLMIYGPPLVMYLRGDLASFRRTVLAFTIAATTCFAVFCVFPVEGPRYAWPAPAGVPDGPLRALALALLEGGSSRGTAFPSSHLAIALAISLSSLRWSRRAGALLVGLSLLLGVGAVYGGFHYAVDMLAGGAVAVGGWILAGRLVGETNVAPA
jgi:membrane-associated phospholipid phosphatase